MEDTIVAPATPPGISAIGIVRISGNLTASLLKKVLRKPSGEPFENIPPRYALYGNVVDPEDGQIIDECVCIFFEKPHSYTGEDVAEFHCHGSPVVMQKLIQVLIKSGCRMAQPGEFTRRAFLNGKIDLNQAEAVAELISALSEEGRKVALSHLQGSLSRALSQPVSDLKDLMASLEVVIDYADEEVVEISDEEIEEKLQKIVKPLEELLKTYSDGKIIREGALVVIAGKPNVGKSSLLNRLLKEERALVSPIPGTTRDYLVEYALIRDIPIRLTDTAGLRKTTEVVEQMGTARTLKWIQEADLVLFLFDASEGGTEEDQEAYEQIRHRPHLLVGNKSDLGRKTSLPFLKEASPLFISALSGEGVEELKDAIIQKLIPSFQPREGAILTLQRHKDSIDLALQHLYDARNTLQQGFPRDLFLTDLRSALEVLLEITGENFTDALLDQIFSTFCVGK